MTGTSILINCLLLRAADLSELVRLGIFGLASHLVPCQIFDILEGFGSWLESCHGIRERVALTLEHETVKGALRLRIHILESAQEMPRSGWYAMDHILQSWIGVSTQSI